MAFSSLALDSRILKAIQEVGYTEPTPIQTAAIPPILAGQDIVGIAQTGTGKTAAFTLPLLSKLASAPGARRGISALILAPTRELVVQIDENVRAYAKHLPVRIALVYGGVSEKPQIDALRGGVDIVVATPGRLIDLMGRRHADFASLRFLVLDEADRMLDMGFLPSIQRIVQVLPRQRQTLMFSATLSREIEALIHKFQQSPKIVQIGRRSNPAETVTQFVYEVPRHLKMSLFVHLLSDPKMNMVLAFARTKHSADRIAKQLEKSGVRTATLHSNRSQNQRLRALKDFKAGLVRVLVATDIASRGIDVDAISHVVNFDFPIHVEDYVHRIGRTGRAHAVGDAVSLVTPDDRAHVRALEKFIGRGLVRKKAEGFDADAKPVEETAPRREDSRRPDRHRQERHDSGAPRRRESPSESHAPRPQSPQRPQGSWDRAARPEFQRPSARPGPAPFAGQPPRHSDSRPPARGPRPDDRRPASDGPRWQSPGAPDNRPQFRGPRDNQARPHDARPVDSRSAPRGGAPMRRDDAAPGGRPPFRGPAPTGPRPGGGGGFRQDGPRSQDRRPSTGPRPAAAPRSDSTRPPGWKPHTKFRD